MPESEKPYAGKYTLNNELPVSEITFEELPDVYKVRYSEMRKDEVSAAIRSINKKPYTGKNSTGKTSALWDLDITDVSGVRDTQGKRVPMPPEIHGSETGKNCSVSEGLLHCWRHSVCHNAFSYLCMLAGIAACERAGMPHGGHHFGADPHDGETVFKVWEYAKNQRLIPQDDPIPQRALTYYAIERGLCKKEDLTRDGRLPPIIYQIALLVAKQEGFNFGRK